MGILVVAAVAYVMVGWSACRWVDLQVDERAGASVVLKVVPMVELKDIEMMLEVTVGKKEMKWVGLMVELKGGVMGWMWAFEWMGPTDFVMAEMKVHSMDASLVGLLVVLRGSPLTVQLVGLVVLRGSLSAVQLVGLVVLRGSPSTVQLVGLVLLRGSLSAVQMQMVG